jgi:hypothetical protein
MNKKIILINKKNKKKEYIEENINQEVIKEFVPPGHFYSCIPKVTNEYNDNTSKFNNIDYNDISHKKIINELNYYLKDFDSYFNPFDKDISKNDSIILKRSLDLKYSIGNPMFSFMDCRLYYYFLLKNKPLNIIEIGCGNSTLLSYNTKKIHNLDYKITCIEPYPSDYLIKLKNMGEIELIIDKLENVDLTIFKILNENDILFIDSSHVAKLNSDVIFYLNNILPLLNKNVYIHIHDIFLPFDYPVEWIKDGRFWNEQYLIYSFLQFNDTFQIEFGNSYAQYKFYEKLEEIQKNTVEKKYLGHIGVFGGGSLWIKKIK